MPPPRMAIDLEVVDMGEVAVGELEKSCSASYFVSASFFEGC